MTRRDRHLAYEGAAILAAGLFGIFAVPALLSAHDTIALVCGAGLFAGWLGWIAFFGYRIERTRK